MTRIEAITIITKALDCVDDTTLEAAAARLASQPTGLTVADIQEAFALNSDLPRALTARELDLIEQSKEDFRLGRTLTLDELKASLSTAATRRATSRRV